MLSTTSDTRMGTAATHIRPDRSSLPISTLNWRAIFWPVDQTLSESSLRVAAYGNIALALAVWFPVLNNIAGLSILAAFITLNLAGVGLVTGGKNKVAEVVILALAPLVITATACLLGWVGNLAGQYNYRLVLTVAAIAPILVLEPKGKALILGLCLFNVSLLVWLEAYEALGLIKLNATSTPLPFSGLLTGALSLAYLASLFFSYRQRSFAKDKQINYLVEALTESAVDLNRINQELKASREALALTSQSKDRLFSIIAHDLRMPMATFQSFSDLLAEHSDYLSPAEVSDMTQGMRKSFNQVKTMLDNLLAWSQNQLQSLKSHPVEFRLCKLLEEVSGIYQETAGRKGVRINLRCEHNLAPVADPDLLATVLRNLISNAIKYSKAGGDIDISAEMTGRNVCLRVRDYGVGMDDETQAQLFTLGTRKSKTGTNGEKGTGLGTVLVRDFLRLMDSEFFMESKLGQGTSVWFYLPATLAHPA